MSIITFCPSCEEETLEVDVFSSGVSYCPGEPDIHWFEGKAECTNCSYIDDGYSDSN